MKKLYNKAELARAEKQSAKLINKIKTAHVTGQSHRARHYTQLYLSSWAAKYVATVKAYRGLPNHHKKADMDLGKIAAKLNPFVGTNETATLHRKKKMELFEDFRPIVDFGVENRALQYLVKRALEAHAELNPCQFGSKGTCKAVKEVLANLADGFRYTAEIDINDCFPRVGVEALSVGLPIPIKVIERVISGQFLNLVPGNIYQLHGGPANGAEIEEDLTDLLNKAIQEDRRGIPQGSAVSSLVVEMLLAPTLSALPKCGRYVNYIDNTLVMAKSVEDLSLMMNSLGGLLSKHPAGPFASRLESCTPPDEEFEFLGYEIFTSSGVYKAIPSYQNLGKFTQKFDKALNLIRDKNRSLRVRKRKAKELKRFVRSWMAAFAAWERSSVVREKRLNDIAVATEHYLKPSNIGVAA